MLGTVPDSHLLPRVTLNLQSRTRNAERDKAIRKRDGYITLKYHTLALIHSIRLFAQYTCPTVCISPCLCDSSLIHFMSQCLAEHEIQTVTKMLWIYGRKKVQLF